MMLLENPPILNTPSYFPLNTQKNEDETMAFHVCIIDDEPWIAIDAMHSIDWAHFNFKFIKHYASSSEALKEIPSMHYDLILVDVRMPVMDGLELIRRLKAAGVQAQFAILSGYSDFEYARTALRLGVQDYFVKPLEPDELHTFLSNLTRKLHSAQPDASAMDPQFSEILGYIDLHASEKLRLEDVADTLGYSKNHICHLFQKNLSKTYVQYLTERRVENACQLLANTQLSLSEIASRCGFSDSAYFNKVFKRETNQTPADYRKNHSGK